MVKVQVEQGWLEGEQLELVTKDGNYFSFKGIPYAEPPIGKLRFKAPRPPLPWDGVRKATKHGEVCPQLDFFTQQLMPGNEDCLFLNVYTRDLKPQQPLPVMVFIHGGGYKCGSGDESAYGPDFLIQHGVILVTINYRLEALGFLCLDTVDVPGNAGLKDQVAALKWVKKNIGSFGGDPNNVTVFGESAGGASTALHVLSPMSNGLFKRAISMSGVPLCDWSLPFEPKRRAFNLGIELGFTTKDPEKLLEFLQSVPVEKLVNVAPSLLAAENTINNPIKMYHFTPVIEKHLGVEHFLTEDPEVLLKKRKFNDVDVMIGYTNEETIIGIPFFTAQFDLYEKYPEMFVPRELLLKCTPSKILKISDAIRKNYIGDKLVGNEVMREFVTYGNHSTFIYNIHRFMKQLPKIGNSRRYFYRFCCVSERNIHGNLGAKYGITGASHLDDTVYLFDPKHAKLSIDKSSKAYGMVNLTCAVFSNFAKFGNPTPDTSLGLMWPEYDDITQIHVDIGEKLTPGQALDRDVYNFWKGIYDEAKHN